MIEKYRTAAWDGKWVEDAAEGAVFIHGGRRCDRRLPRLVLRRRRRRLLPGLVDELLSRGLEDGRVKIGSQQSTKLVADIPAIGPSPR